MCVCVIESVLYLRKVEARVWNIIIVNLGMMHAQPPLP